MMRDVTANYIIYWVDETGKPDDFDRCKNTSLEQLRQDALELWRRTGYHKYQTIEIWQADKKCYETVCDKPCQVVSLTVLDKLYN